MAQLDRLTDLMSHFALQVEPAAPEAAQLFVLSGAKAEDQCRGEVVMLTPHAPGQCQAQPGETVLFSARVSWGGARSPMPIL